MLTIVKIGGHVIDDEASLKGFLDDFAKIEGAKLLIHGGGKTASTIGKQLGIEPQMHEGRRITDKSTRDLVTMVYGGLLNKQIVAKLQALGINAIGLSGADGNLLEATKRPVNEIDFGFVGDVSVENVNSAFLDQLFTSGMVPVIPALTHDGEGHMLNTNADTMAATIAEAMQQKMPVSLCYCFEQAGVMHDMAKGNVISDLSEETAKTLHQEGVIHSGMLPKLHNAFSAKKAGVSVKIGHFKHLMDMINDNHKGTDII